MQQLISRIAHAAQNTPSYRVYPPTSMRDVEEAENAMDVTLPEILRLSYTTIANGGFGPGDGIIGVREGNDTEFGTLVETYRQLHGDNGEIPYLWPDNVVPICGWGCNIFSCVECDGVYDILTFEDAELDNAGYDIEEFFEMWLSGEAVFT